LGLGLSFNLFSPSYYLLSYLFPYPIYLFTQNEKPKTKYSKLKNSHTNSGWSIFCCAIMFPILFYQSTFGALTAAIFGSSMLLGFLSVDLNKYLKEKKTTQENNVS
jgi:hypothetical protein